MTEPVETVGSDLSFRAFNLEMENAVAVGALLDARATRVQIHDKVVGERDVTGSAGVVAIFLAEFDDRCERFAIGELGDFLKHHQNFVGNASRRRDTFLLEFFESFTDRGLALGVFGTRDLAHPCLVGDRFLLRGGLGSRGLDAFHFAQLRRLNLVAKRLE